MKDKLKKTFDAIKYAIITALSAIILWLFKSRKQNTPNKAKTLVNNIKECENNTHNDINKVNDTLNKLNDLKTSEVCKNTQESRIQELENSGIMRKKNV